MMTIDEAISLSEVLVQADEQHAEVYEQLADWLSELRRARMTIDLLKILRDGFKEDAKKLKAENERLEKQLAQYGLFCEVVGDPAVEFASLRREIHRAERDNVKLRELVYDMLQDEERGHNDELTFDEHVERANELGVRLDG